MKREEKICRWMVFAVLMLTLVGCEQRVGEGEPAKSNAPYGYYYLGEEEVAVRSCTTAEGVQFLLKISPLEDVMTATTYAIVGVHNDLLGKELNVEYKYHNDDYIFVYEDPVCYYSHLRPLQSGTIYLSRSASGTIGVKVDVVLYDGTPFRYAAEGLTVPENE